MSLVPPKIGFVSLGCPKALVDSERIITQLRAEGYDIWPQYEGADLVVINTCGFIEDAVTESMETISEAMNENGRVIVTGCLGVNESLIRAKHPEILAITGPHATNEVMTAIHKHAPPTNNPHIQLVPAAGIKLTPAHYAYLKISEGCNHKCRFCIIPSLRGPLDSRPFAEIMQEASALAESGVKELLVIAQDTSAYGLDIKYQPAIWHGQAIKSHITDLARALGQLGIWIRLHYVYPYPHVDDLIPMMAEGLVLPYLDIPMQHASPTILKAMKRPANESKMLDRIKLWREICPELTLRSTFIVGFPGETEDDFNYLLDFLHKAQLDRVGCFSYSDIEGARANQLANPIPEEVKLARLERFMAVQGAISTDKLQNKIGNTMDVLVDDVDAEVILARTQGDAPEVDGQVIIKADGKVRSGDLCRVKITHADEHDLWADLI
ncbi:MAG: 30S ribosomal protein S12 methylthiotransferase RimO [Gammaproteobacteria bacterium]|nr:30S ribosomal protein S12 methylthiotransferase RimO [Gammaproteobacteria bacterium]